MESLLQHPPAIVVGIDGSHAAISAALWAVDEAVTRDIPLRLVYAIAPREEAATTDAAARDLATAEVALLSAVTAVQSLDRPVKLEVDIAQNPPTRVLRGLSYSAEMVCLGALGLGQATGSHVGSTATVVAASAHCPVAIIGSHPHGARGPRWVIAEIDETRGGRDVLDRAVAEALLRGVPLRVLTAWGSGKAPPRVVAENNRRIRARQERLLAQYRARHPGLDAHAVAVHGTTVKYVARHAGSVELLVIGRRRTGGLADLLDPACHSVVSEMRCSVLICPASRAL